MENIKFDFSRLRGRIVEKFGNNSAFCAAAGMSMQRLSARLTNRIPFQGPEIKLFCSSELLDIADEEIGNYFFTAEVR